MKKLLAACIVLASHVALAESYHAELNESFSNGNIETGDNTSDKDQKFIGGSYYFKKVDTDQGPLGEAAFLSKSSSVSALFGETKYEDQNETASFDDTAFAVHIAAPNGLIVNLDYIGARDEDNHDDVETISVGAGTYIKDRHALVFSYDNEIAEDSSDYKISTERYDLNYHGVIPLNADAAIAIDADLAYLKADYDGDFDQEGNDISADVTYYPTKRLGLVVGLGNSERGDITTKSWSIGAEYFLIEGFAVKLAYTSTEEDDDNADDTVDFDAVAIGATVRFN